MSGDRRVCPDGGVCARLASLSDACDVGCHRVGHGLPEPGVYPDNEWPQSVRDAPPPMPAIEFAMYRPNIAKAQRRHDLRERVAAANARAQGKGDLSLVRIELDAAEVAELAEMITPMWECPAASPYAGLSPSRIAEL